MEGTTDLFDVYRGAYLDIRARYQHPEEPIQPTGHGKCFPETLPPKGWDRDTYGDYFGEVWRLASWYVAARRYASMKRKTPEDRQAYLAACDEYGVAGHDLRFADEPNPALF